MLISIVIAEKIVMMHQRNKGEKCQNITVRKHVSKVRNQLIVMPKVVFTNAVRMGVASA